MNKKLFCIYPVCNRNDIGIFFNEETQQYFTYTGKGRIPEKTIRNVGIIFTPIIMGSHYFFNPMWMNLITVNTFKLLIAVFLILYICFAYVVSIRILNSIYNKSYSIIPPESLELTIYDIKNGEENLRKAHKLLFIFYLVTLLFFALFIKFKIFLLFLLFLGVLFCNVLLYAGVLPQKRKRFYEKYKKEQSKKIWYT